MKKINGNTIGILQIRQNNTKNAIGEVVPVWTTSHTLKGFLDYASGDSSHTNFNGKTQESTHYFISDYSDLGSVTADNARMIIEGKTYDVILIDNPMNLNYHLEFYLKFTGGVVNG